MLLENDLYPQDIRVRDEARSLVAAGYDVAVIAPRGPGQRRREVVDGVAVERFRLPLEHAGGIGGLLLEYAIAHVQLYLRAARALMRGADVLHLHNPPDTLFPPAAFGRALGRRTVFDQHDLFPDLFVAKFGPSPVVRVLRAAQGATYRTADLVLTTNDTQRDAVVATGRVGPEDVVIVRNGPLRAVLDRASEPRPGRLSDPRLLFVGAVEAQDGVDWLPELMAALVRDHGLADAHLTVAGMGTRVTPVRDAFERAGLGAHATFTGRIEHDEVLARIGAADICLDLAPCDELNHRTTMAKIAEYLALGRPTVSFALRETQRTAGEAVRLVPCNDRPAYVRTVAELAADGEARAALAARARERAPDLVWERSAESLVAAYARLARGRSAKST
jgi:glycosyltransferase involved in cell wall biosynthesis